MKEQLLSSFPGLTFDAVPHTYTVDGESMPSVSHKIKDFYDDFDSYVQSNRYADRNNFSQEDVLNAWEGEALLATDSGTRVHEFGEDYAKWKYFGEGERPKVTCKQCLGVVQFYDTLPPYMVPAALELQMYSKEFKFCGTADIILLDKRTDTLSVWDFKSNKSIYGNVKYPDAPLKHINRNFNLLQDNYGKYSVQLSHYQLMLEEAKFKVTHRVIIWLRDQPDKKLFKTLSCPDLKDEIKRYYTHGDRKKY